MSRMFVPGPVDVADDVLQAQAAPMLPHRSKEFEAIYRRASEKAQQLFFTSQRVFLTASSGTGLQEAAALWRSLRPLITFLETQPSVATVKAGCEMVGFPVGPPRPPLLPLSPAQAATLAQLVDGLQVARSRVL